MNPASTIHGMPIPPGYASITVEQIVEPTHITENLRLNFVGGDGEKTLGDTLHEIVLWRKADIKLKLTANNKAPMDPPPSAPSPLDYGNVDRDPTPSPEQRAGSTPTPPAPEGKGKKKTASLPLPGPTNKKRKRVEKKIGPKKKLAYELTQEELDEEVDREVKEHFKPKVQ